MVDNSKELTEEEKKQVWVLVTSRADKGKTHNYSGRDKDVKPTTEVKEVIRIINSLTGTKHREAMQKYKREVYANNSERQGDIIWRSITRRI